MYHVFQSYDRAMPIAQDIKDYLQGDIPAAQVNWHPIVFNSDFDYNDPDHCEKVIISFYFSSLNYSERDCFQFSDAIDYIRDVLSVQGIANFLLRADEDEVFRFQERI